MKAPCGNCKEAYQIYQMKEKNELWGEEAYKAKKIFQESIPPFKNQKNSVYTDAILILSKWEKYALHNSANQ